MIVSHVIACRQVVLGAAYRLYIAAVGRPTTNDVVCLNATAVDEHGSASADHTASSGRCAGTYRCIGLFRQRFYLHFKQSRIPEYTVWVNSVQYHLV